MSTISSFTQSATVSPAQTATAAQYNGMRHDMVLNAGDYALATGITNAFVLSIDGQADTLTAGFVVKFLANIGVTASATLVVNSLPAKNIKKNGATDIGSGDIVAGQAVQVIYDGTNYQMISPYQSNPSKFGGTGADGPLSISSGTMTIALVGVTLVEKNYTSISITGTGRVVFTGSHTNGTVVIFKSQGNVTLNSSTLPYLDLSGLGGQGGAGAATNSNTSGSNGQNGRFILDNFSHIGQGGAIINGGNGGGSYSNTFTYTKSTDNISLSKALWLATGSGGGGGGSGGVGNCTAGGNGGNGGGAFRLECAGALIFTGSGGVSVAGQTGFAGTDSSVNGTSGGGGGGGGSAGMAIILANSITTNTGTINTAGGTGGKGGNGKGSSGTDRGGGGGGGGGDLTTGSTGGAGQTGAGASGGNLSGGGGGGGGGGDANTAGTTNTGGSGGAGVASDNLLVALNTEF